MRKLTVIRKKSLVSALLKAYLYIESHDRTVLILNGKKLKEVGVLKNGGSITIEIPEQEITIFIVHDKLAPKISNTSYTIPKGTNDITLYAKPKFNPFKGNPYTITEI